MVGRWQRRCPARGGGGSKDPRVGLLRFDTLVLPRLSSTLKKVLRRIEQASPIDRRSTNSRSSRLRTRSNKHAQNTQNAKRNIYRTCRKHARNVPKMNENRCPERSKELLRCRTQCSKQRLKYIQHASKIIVNRGPEGSKIKENLENRGPEGDKIKENLALDGS